TDSAYSTDTAYVTETAYGDETAYAAEPLDLSDTDPTRVDAGIDPATYTHPGSATGVSGESRRVPHCPRGSMAVRSRPSPASTPGTGQVTRQVTRRRSRPPSVSS